MVEPSLAARLTDIIEAIEHIRSEMIGVTIEAFDADWRKRWLIERGSPGNGVDLRANNSLAGIDGASGFFSGGSGLGSSEPGSIGSIKCLSCATAELAAARKRTASRQTTARISNDTPYGAVTRLV